MSNEVRDQIRKLLIEAEAKIHEAETIADENNVSFQWDGPEYGMGGYYEPKYTDSNGYTSFGAGWSASSHSC